MGYRSGQRQVKHITSPWGGAAKTVLGREGGREGGACGGGGGGG